MLHALCKEALEALERSIRRRPLLAFDFDGTLADIVEHPDDARVEPAFSAALSELASLLPVAIVTGRSVADVADRLGFSPAYIVGSHGAEDPSGEIPAGSVERLDLLRDRLHASARSWRAAGVSLEDKGKSLALHYRRAADPVAARRVAEDLVSNLPEGLRSFGGKCVVNVVPHDAPDKGLAVLALMRRAGADVVIYVGDDVNDEAVFERAEPGWLTVRVGRDDLASAAMYGLDSHEQALGLLNAMIAIARRVCDGPGKMRNVVKGTDT